MWLGGKRLKNLMRQNSGVARALGMGDSSFKSCSKFKNRSKIDDSHSYIKKIRGSIQGGPSGALAPVGPLIKKKLHFNQNNLFIFRLRDCLMKSLVI